MEEVILFLIGFLFALYIYRRRYLALNEISEFIVCLERIDPEKLLAYDYSKEISNHLSQLNLRVPHFDVDFRNVVFKEPKIIASELHVKRQKILDFLKTGYIFYDEYFKANTDLLSQILTYHEARKQKTDFIVNFIIENSRISQMAEDFESSGSWALDEQSQDRNRRKLEEAFAKLDGTTEVMEELFDGVEHIHFA
ncbi:MAG: hypothetical protein GTN74_08235 [Proteobacteria bacterium]|nr:hypothetical protein [Pseudomonadota bacterium]